MNENTRPIEEALLEYNSLSKIIEQIEKMNYTCEAGDLKNNIAFVALKRKANDQRNFIIQSPVFKAVKESQEILAKWIVPDSEVSNSDCLDNLLSLLDNETLVKYMNSMEKGEECTGDNSVIE